jgi:glycine cleavage system regulatory protein
MGRLAPIAHEMRIMMSRTRASFVEARNPVILDVETHNRLNFIDYFTILIQTHSTDSTLHHNSLPIRVPHAADLPSGPRTITPAVKSM